LINSGKPIEAEFLEKAITYIDDRFVYCYEGMIVLGVWGMNLRDNVREDISEIRKDLINKKKHIQLDSGPQQTKNEIPIQFTITFQSGEHGRLNGKSFVTKLQNEFIDDGDIPKVEPNEGYEFVGWDENPYGHELTGNKEFVAKYKAKETPLNTPPLPWYTRFWNWL